MIVPQEKTQKVLEILRGQAHTQNAAVIGKITEAEKGRVVMRTAIGTQTYLPQPGNELLPRIC
jgi:hydrogenase expression/formation protein HypE